jgi:hypothetical protein
MLSVELGTTIRGYNFVKRSGLGLGLGTVYAIPDILLNKQKDYRLRKLVNLSSIILSVI